MKGISHVDLVARVFKAFFFGRRQYLIAPLSRRAALHRSIASKTLSAALCDHRIVQSIYDVLHATTVFRFALRERHRFASAGGRGCAEDHNQ